MSGVDSYELTSTYLRLRPDVSIEPLPVDQTFWPRLMGGELGSFHNEFLVTSFAFDADWPSWEIHPNGDEIVCLIEGAVTLVLESDGAERRIDLTQSGSYVLVPRGTWHTAKVKKSARMLFITAGEGTQNRPIGSA
jgi:quercetin dioxygenase-like cupin family protein